MSMNYQNIPLGLPSNSNSQCRVIGVSSVTDSHRDTSEQRRDPLLTENTDLLRDHWEMPSSDVQTLKWIQSKSEHRWYLFTVTFKDSSIDPKQEKYIHLFDTYVHKRIQKTIGYSHRANTFMFVREYECSVIGASGNINCPHHVHCILGVPVTARNDRLTKGYQAAIAHPKSRIIESADLQELRTNRDIEQAYCYVRKRKWYRMMGA
jgi:hypothetical protein